MDRARRRRRHRSPPTRLQYKESSAADTDYENITLDLPPCHTDKRGHQRPHRPAPNTRSGSRALNGAGRRPLEHGRHGDRRNHDSIRPCGLVAYRPASPKVVVSAGPRQEGHSTNDTNLTGLRPSSGRAARSSTIPTAPSRSASTLFDKAGKRRHELRPTERRLRVRSHQWTPNIHDPGAAWRATHGHTCLVGATRSPPLTTEMADDLDNPVYDLSAQNDFLIRTVMAYFYAHAHIWQQTSPMTTRR